MDKTELKQSAASTLTASARYAIMFAVGLLCIGVIGVALYFVVAIGASSGGHTAPVRGDHSRATPTP